MHRPASVSNSDLQRYIHARVNPHDRLVRQATLDDGFRRLFTRSALTQPEPASAALCPFAQVFYAGEWLAEQLAARGMGNAEVRAIARENARLQLQSEDPWTVSASTLARYCPERIKEVRHAVAGFH